MKNSKVFNWIIALCGLWESGDIAALFVPGFGPIQAFVWNHILVGILLVFVGAAAALTSHADTAKKLDWIAAVAGIWLIIAPFILGIPEIAAGLWNDVIVGLIVFILATWAALLTARAAG